MIRWLGILIILICTVFWASSLSFFPVSWPDDSAFFLTGIDFVKWPPSYLMHAQAPFVPTYDLANFNTMPLLPLLLGLGHKLGITGSHGIRLWGMAAFALWALLLVWWMSERKLPPVWICLIATTALFSPAIRWGAMVVRTEIWEGLFWLLILIELDRSVLSPWRMAIFLGAAAYFHFEAIVWVLPTGIGLLGGGINKSLRRIYGVIWRTLIVLSPWFLYVLWHWDIFWIQMATQFGRLETHHPYIQDLYGLFHSLFMSLGNPVSYPKFFNLGKVLTWGLMLFAIMANLRLAILMPEKRQVRLAAIAAVICTFYLWVTKPETWFTTMIHLSLWPLLILALSPNSRQNKWQIFSKWQATTGAAVALLLLVLLEAGVAVHQWRKSRGVFSWVGYQAWVSCIDETVATRTKIWQPHWPDVLVELAAATPKKWDFSRAVDFQGIDPLIEKHASNSEAIIHSLYFGPDEPQAKNNYTGDPREMDHFYLTDYPWLPFKNFSAIKLGSAWSLKICQRGPFWAALSLRTTK